MEINQRIIEHLSKLSDDELTALFTEQIRIKKKKQSLLIQLRKEKLS